MIRITIEGHGHEKVAKSVYDLLVMERKIVRHYKINAEQEDVSIGTCDVAIFEIKDEKEKTK